jgi:hypothetical protein
VGTEVVAAGEAMTELAIERPASETAPEPAAPAAKSMSPAVAGLAIAVVLGGVSAFVGYRLIRAPSTPPPSDGLSAVPTAPVATPAVAPHPSGPPPAATFSDESVSIKGAITPQPPLPHPAFPPEKRAPAAPTVVVLETPLDATVAPQPRWTFEGTAFDLMTGKPVFAAKLSLVDAKGAVVGTGETGTNGHYVMTVPAGPPEGYSLKISQPDYLERCIDQGESTLSLREATPEDRQVLIHAAHSRAWIGRPGGASKHDLALIPVDAGNQ